MFLRMMEGLAAADAERQRSILERQAALSPFADLIERDRAQGEVLPFAIDQHLPRGDLHVPKTVMIDATYLTRWAA